jgi:hypothetical protein
MSNKIRIAALVVAFIAAGCVSSNEVAPVGAAASAEHPLVFGDMHAAIPADKGNEKFFEYN